MSTQYQNHFSVSILLWMRKDKSRQSGMDYWKGPHSQIIASSPGLLEYRQQHLSDYQHSFWPEMSGLKTAVPEDRRVDGIAEVTFESLLSPIKGRKQTALAFQDEVNVFRRTLMHMGMPFSSRWYATSSTASTEVRDVIYLQRREGVSNRVFKKMIYQTLAETMAKSKGVTELRTQVYMPWHKKSWDTPKVAHDNPKEEQLHASIIIGFDSDVSRKEFYQNITPELNRKLVSQVSAIYAYHMSETITFVEDSKRQKP